ncbi:NfeD family protein [Gilvimarinus polysaccharolyticus]|uniref:NfeD family protein n=1 Tax=Gilvimarinus polysaccharolyticus TaxID=863921 RepID=UPI000673A155|nr:NfeD family protein [Gilvimarinus polysaccharolyticus]
MQEYELSTLWFIAGIVLMVLEILLPGGIVFFLGLGASLVALLLFTGFIDGWIQAFTAWFVGSLLLLFGLRGVVQKLIPAQVERGGTDEDLDAYDQIVEVAETIPPGGEGRIMFRGSTWNAKNYHQDQNQALEAGTRVRVVFRDNLRWTVEALDSPENQNEKPME